MNYILSEINTVNAHAMITDKKVCVVPCLEGFPYLVRYHNRYGFALIPSKLQRRYHHIEMTSIQMEM